MLMSSPKYNVTEERQKPGGYAVHMRLVIHNLTAHDIGHYTCVAKNSIGEVDSSINVYCEWTSQVEQVEGGGVEGRVKERCKWETAESEERKWEENEERKGVEGRRKREGEGGGGEAWRERREG